MANFSRLRNALSGIVNVAKREKDIISGKRGREALARGHKAAADYMKHHDDDLAEGLWKKMQSASDDYVSAKKSRNLRYQLGGSIAGTAATTAGLVKLLRENKAKNDKARRI